MASVNDSILSKYDDKSLKFVFDESCKLLDETFKSFRESNNKSSILCAIYLSMVSYCFAKIFELGFVVTIIPFCITIVGTLISIYIIHKNLFPGEMKFAGTQPINLVHAYFEQFSNEVRIDEMMKLKIEDNNRAISFNIDEINSRGARFKDSAKSFIASIILGFSSLWLL